MSLSTIKIILLWWVIIFLTQTIGIDSFLFERTSIEQGQWWRLITGHLVHSNEIHLLLNMLALALVIWLFEDVISAIECSSLIVVSAFLQSTVFYFYLPQVNAYVGLSGVIHSLYVVGTIMLLARPQEKVWALALLSLVTLKLLTESLGQGISMTQDMIGGHVLTEAHLLGAMIGVVYGLCKLGITWQLAP